MSEQERATLAEAAFEAIFKGFETGDFAPFGDYLADDVALTLFDRPKGVGVLRGKDDVLRLFARIGKAFPRGLAFRVRNVLVGAAAVAIEFEDWGTAADGRDYDNYGVSVFEFDANGKIAAYREYIDTVRVKSFLSPSAG